MRDFEQGDQELRAVWKEGLPHALTEIELEARAVSFAPTGQVELRYTFGDADTSESGVEERENEVL